MTKLFNHLLSLGLTDKESKTYLAILELGKSTIKPIAERAHLKRTSIYNFIDRLVKLGLITRTTIRGRNYYSPLTPTSLVQLQKERLTNLEAVLPQFVKLFNNTNIQPKVQYFEGPEEVKNIVLQETLCKKEALYVWTGKEMLGMVGGIKFMKEVEKKRIKNGVFIRTVRFRDKDITYPLSGHGKKYLRELRWAPEGMYIPMGIGIYDTGKVGLFSSTNERFGILVESKDFAETMRIFYELLWRKCIPAEAGEG